MYKFECVDNRTYPGCTEHASTYFGICDLPSSTIVFDSGVLSAFLGSHPDDGRNCDRNM